MAIKTILVSQPKPEGEKSPYFDLASKYKLKIDFRPFIKVEGVDVKDFRSQRINLPEQTAVSYRKRKIFFARQTILELSELMKKHKTEKYLLPCTDILRDNIPVTLEEQGISFSKVILYRTVASDLSDLDTQSLYLYS